MFVALAVLGSIAVAPADAREALHFENCTPGASVALASGSCANVIDDADPHERTPGYDSWGEGLSKDGLVQPETFEKLSAGPSGTVTVLSIEPESHLVRIRDGAGKEVWVGADALACGPSTLNVATYGERLSLIGTGSCGATEPPISPARLVGAAADANSDLYKRIVSRAEGYYRATLAKTKSDSLFLGKIYLDERFSDDARFTMLQNARKKLKAMQQRAHAIYGENCDRKVWDHLAFPINDIMKAKGERLCRTLNDSMRLFKLTRMDEGADQASVLKTFQWAAGIGALTMNVSPLDLPMKMILYYGLPDAEREKLHGAAVRNAPDRPLNFLDPDSHALLSMENSVNGSAGAPVDELYNGYLYNAAASAPGDPAECAAFALHYVFHMTQAEEAGKHRWFPTVQDFNFLHASLTPNEGYMPSKYSLSRYHDCFAAVNLRAGQVPMPGDLVSSAGHIVVVRGFNPATYSIDTVEAASGQCGSVCTMTRPLLEPSCGGDSGRTRPLRADLRVLRYVGGPHCPLDLQKD